MIETILICGVWAAFCVAACAIYTKQACKKVREKTINETISTYQGMVRRFTDGIQKECPECAFSENGTLCDKMDIQNFVRYGTCTNYEKKRF